MEAEILANRKKRIFLAGETIDLLPSTVSEVVRILEGHDLHGIDEDLNGRMFETFLNATVRGRELGQYFTPRGVVKYMTKSANLTLNDRRLPRVIDACCGSGGFLIEALATMTNEIRNSAHLTNTQKDELQTQLENDTLYGIEAHEEIGRVARLNMYLHGDGGSRIYVTDTLDKQLEGEEGLPSERQQHLEELRNRIADREFDVALTNPPFSMSYKENVESERAILDQYRISEGKTRNSNVLFLERYLDFLKPDGELLTVIDDTVLNGTNSEYARDFIREHFIIRQIVSLPFNTFYRAQAGSKTSILHLRRKRQGEQQGDVFMAIANNVGHDDYKRDTLHRDNLPEIASHFAAWAASGRVPDIIRENEVVEPVGCPMQVFVVRAENLKERIDAFYYAPHLMKLRQNLQEREDAGEITIKRGRDFVMASPLTGSQRNALRGQPARYFEISDVARDGTVLNWSDASFEDHPTRIRWHVDQWNVLFPRAIRSLWNRRAGS